MTANRVVAAVANILAAEPHSKLKDALKKAGAKNVSLLGAIDNVAAFDIPPKGQWGSILDSVAESLGGSVKKFKDGEFAINCPGDPSDGIKPFHYFFDFTGRNDDWVDVYVDYGHAK